MDGKFKDPEIFLGFVCPVGVRVQMVIEESKEALASLGYSTVHVKLSETISTIPRYAACQKREDEYERLINLMSAGDHLRTVTKVADAVARACLTRVRTERKRITGDPEKPAQRVAYLFDSIKHPSEIELFRSIYGKLFFCFSVFDTRSNRVNALAERLSDSNHGYEIGLSRGSAEDLIEKDFNTKGVSAGQNVCEAFPISDAFLRIQDSSEVRNKLQRILEIWFGHPFHTPSMDEYGMFFAKAASLRSSDLSRQVGATILSNAGEVVSVGCNEVPHPGGRLVWPGTKPDKRDFKVGFDSTTKMKVKMVSEIIHRLNKSNYIDLKGEAVDDLALDLLSGKNKNVLFGTRLSNVIEFGRVVHAEMTAITECARRGISTLNHILYSTTYPCHICARHIIACGIRRVVYIEPYVKSMAKDLYGDLLTVDDHPREDTVNFEPFEGLGPLRYAELFEMGAKRRKEPRKGEAIHWNGKKESPVVDRIPGFYLTGEEAAINFVNSNKESFGFTPLNDKDEFIWQKKQMTCMSGLKSVETDSQGEANGREKQGEHSSPELLKELISTLDQTSATTSTI